MTPTILTVADAARCRLFRMAPAESEDIEPIVVLEELEDLVNPEARASWQEVYSNTKSGRNRAPGGGPAHGYDDHRAAHDQEMRRRFARSIQKRLGQTLSEQRATSLVLVAEPSFLAFLRQELSAELRQRTQAEIAKEATKQSVDDLRRLLEAQAVLRPAPPPRASFRPRGQA